MLQARLAADFLMASGACTAARLRELSAHFASTYNVDAEQVFIAAREMLPAYVRESLGG